MSANFWTAPEPDLLAALVQAIRNVNGDAAADSMAARIARGDLPPRNLAREYAEAEVDGWQPDDACAHHGRVCDCDLAAGWHYPNDIRTGDLL